MLWILSVIASSGVSSPRNAALSSLDVSWVALNDSFGKIASKAGERVGVPASQSQGELEDCASLAVWADGNNGALVGVGQRLTALTRP